MADAQTLLLAGSDQNSYVHGALAVELALKGRIMHQERLNKWPSRKRRPELHTHILGNLLSAAGLKPVIEKDLLEGGDIGLAWLVVKDFDINTRYPIGKPFPRHISEDMVEAIGKLGLVEWLITGIT